MDLSIERVKAKIAALTTQRDFHRNQSIALSGAIQGLEELLEEPTESPNGKPQPQEAATAEKAPAAQ